MAGCCRCARLLCFVVPCITIHNAIKRDVQTLTDSYIHSFGHQDHYHESLDGTRSGELARMPSSFNFPRFYHPVTSTFI